MKIQETLDEHSSATMPDVSARPVLADGARKLERVAHSTLPSIVRREPGERLALSFAQQRLWFLAQIEGASEAYHISYGVRVKGHLDRTALRRALDRIIARHEALRTSFSVIDGEPVQRIASVEDSRFHLLEHDLRGHSNAHEELNSLIGAEVDAPFDLEHGPLIRGRLIRVSDNEHALLLTMHHIVSDAWSMGVLIHELSKLYSAFACDEADPLPELKVQFPDCALWQHQRIESDTLREQAAYWKAALTGAPTVLELPTDHPRPAEQNFAGAFVEIALNERLTARLKDLSRRHRTTLYMTLLAAWGALMARLSGQQDVIIGSPSANRGQAEIENLIGFFVNTLAVRLDLSDSPTIGELLQRTKTQIIAAQLNQDIPFERVVELVQPVRSLSHSPLCQVMFTWQNTPRETLRLADSEIQSLGALLRRMTKFDVTLYLQAGNGDITGRIEYATSLFERTTIERYREYFLAMLEAMVADDTQCVDHVVLLSAEERQQVLEEWNDTGREIARGTLAELVEQQAERTPDAVAIRHGEVTLSYRKLEEQANQLAHYLRAQGVRAGAVVVVGLPRSMELVVAFLGVLKAGAVYLPLDPGYPVERRRFMLEDAQPVGLLTRRELWGELPEGVQCWDWAEAEERWKQLGCERVEGNRSSGSDAAYIVYTSGSTGKPKGVVVPHEAIVRVAHNNGFARIEAEDRMAFASDPAFDAAMLEVWGPLLAGGSVVVVEQETLLSPEQLGRLLEQEGVNVLWLTAGLFNQYADALSGVFARMKYLMAGGDVLDPGVIERVLRQSRPQHLLNGYGPTETAVFASTYEIEGAVEGRSVPIGRPIGNTRMYILDERGEPVPVGVVGEIYIGGRGVVLGYLQRGELTAERFVPEPFNLQAGARMYRTGDLGRWRGDGTIEFYGRNDGQVKVRGYRIELGEIEAKLREVRGVGEAVVVARGEQSGEKRLVAYYTSAEHTGATEEGAAEKEEAVSAEQLRAELVAVLPEYMVPAAYVRLEQLPMTRSGKVDRRALPEPEAAAYAGARYEEPEGETEQALAGIWAELLKVERISRHDNFFNLGGHSLLAVRVVNTVRARLGGTITVRDVFAHPVLKDLAGVMRGTEGSRQELIPRAERAGLEPLSYAQQRLWFVSQTESGSRAYHVPFGVELRGQLDVEALCRALDRIAERHEALRTTFEVVEGEPQQRVREAEGFRLVQEDVRGSTDPMAEVRERTKAEVGERFDLEHGPVVRGRLVRHGEEAYTLLVTMHHIASDGWSMGIFWRELETLYGTFTRGETDPLPGLPVQYADYALWQRSEAEAGKLELQKQYWERTLAGAPAVLELPMDHPRPAQQGYAGGVVRLELDAELSRGLKELSQRAGTTLFMTILSGWMAVLGRLARQEDVVVGTPVANRGHAQIEGLIGFFANALALRAQVKSELTVRELLKRVKECALEAQQHQDIPFEQVVERVRPERSLAHSPIFQTMFAWQNNEGQTLNLPGLEARASKGAAHVVSRFDLTLSMRERGEEIAGALEYATSLFDEATVLRMGGYLRTMLAAMVENEEREIGTIELLSAEERQQVLEEWNDTAHAAVVEETLPELFEQQVERTPNAVAVVCGQQQVSYRELNRRANQLAQYLRRIGVGAEVAVGLCMERSVEMVVGLLGVLKAGGAYVPLDANYPAERLGWMLEDTQAPVLLTQSHLEAQLPPYKGKMIRLDREWEQISRCGESNLECEVNGESLAYVIYTSGSTGRPKGVGIRHRSAVELLHWGREVFSAEELSGVLASTSICFDLSVYEIFVPLSWGGKVIVAANALELPQLGAKEQVKLVNTVPSAMQELVRSGGVPESVVTVNLAGEALTTNLVRQVYGVKNVERVLNLYGPSEDTTYSTYAWIRREEAEAEEKATVTIGRPIYNTQVYVVDEELKLVPVGVVGELYMGGEGLARGYLNRPELTAERFVPNPFSRTAGGQRLYRTGDQVRWGKDGNLEFLGRLDQQVKIRGFRIELGEIEAALQQCAGVRQAVVVARGEQSGEKRLVAYYTREAYAGEAEGEVNPEQLRADLGAVLPEYMVPAAYVRLEQLPMTRNGKVDRQGLPAPDAEAYAYARTRYEEPQGKIEQELAEIWAELLKVERVGRHDNFFNLGGHSLVSVRLLSQIRTHFHSECSLQDIFRYPVLKDFAGLLMTGNDQMLPDAQVLADLALDSSIQQDSSIWQEDQSEFNDDPEHVLLTGATGFLGAFLLRSLVRRTNATIYCLARANSPSDALTRVRAAMNSYGIGQDFVNSRIVAIPGDLSAPNLGLETAEFRRLANRIDFVLHSGAWVNSAHTYNTLKQVNVDGTRELLRFASLGAPKPIHYISTFNTVLTQTRYPDLADQAQCQEYFKTLRSGYAQSKWVAEMLLQIAQTRGLAATIYRLPLLGAARCTGASNSNDLVSRFIDQCRQVGSIPEIKSDVNMIPVDDLADMFLAVARRGLQGIRYNIVNDANLSMKRLVERMSALSEGELKPVPANEWLRRCTQSADGTVLATTLQSSSSAPGASDWAVSAQRCDTHSTLKVMHSPIDDEYLDQYLLWRMGNGEQQHLVAKAAG